MHTVCIFVKNAFAKRDRNIRFKTENVNIPNSISSESYANIPALITPHMPHTPCTGNASNGSSIFNFSNNLEVPQQIAPEYLVDWFSK